jgi:hypothetical protein
MKRTHPLNLRLRLLTLVALMAGLSTLLAGCQPGGPTNPDAPAILSFAPDSAVVYSSSGSTTLRWEVRGAGVLLELLSSDGGARSVTGQSSVVVTPDSSLPAVTYTLVARNDAGDTLKTTSVVFPTRTSVRGSLALDNLIDDGQAEIAGLETLSRGELFRRDLADVVELLPEVLAAAAPVELLSPLMALQRERVVSILQQIASPTSIYSDERVVVVDALGNVQSVSPVGKDGSWQVEIPRFGVYAVLRGRIDAQGDLVCFQPLEVEARSASGRALSVQPLLVRSVVAETELVGRFALNELTGHLSAVSAAVSEELRLPEDLAGFFQISDQVLRCNHPNPAKLSVEASFSVETPVEDGLNALSVGVNAPGVLDFGNLWTTRFELGSTVIETLGSSAIDDEGTNSTDVRYNADEDFATLPLFHDTCLLNFDKCEERFEEGEPLLPFVGVLDLAVDSASFGDEVSILRRATTVQTATVRGRATRANGTAVPNALILVTNTDTGSVGMGRSDRNGNFQIAVSLGGRNQFQAVSNIRGVGRGTMDCGNCSFNRVAVFDGRDAGNVSTNVVYR